MKAVDKSCKPTSFGVKPSKRSRPMDTKTSQWVEEYLNFFTGKMQPVPESFLDKLAEELINYAETTDVLRIEWFFTKKRMLPQSGRNWAAKYDKFGEAYKTAQFILGMRREKLAMEKQLSDSMVLKTLYLFDPMYAQARQDDIDAKIEVAKANAEALERPSQIILGQLPGLEEYKKQIEEKE